MKRRNFLKASALVPVSVGAAAISPVLAQTPTPLEAMTTQVSDSLFASDGLAVPVPDKPVPSRFAAGLDRTLVLGGGGEYYVAWYCGFFHGLLELGVDPAALAEMVVGTSAGSYAGSSLTSGHFLRMRSEIEFFGQFPSLFAKLAPLSAPNASQKRAQEINFKVTSGDAASIRAIGHAALAADNHVNGGAVERLAWLLTGDSRTDWPVAKMFTTANDCYTGERLVVHQDVARKNGIPLAHAAAASSSLPGVMGPTLLGQRYCMDGGISKTWAHTDLVAGSKRALIITLTNGYEGSLLTGIPHDIHKEIATLEATGTKAMLIIAGTPPGVNLLDPGQIAPAIKAGYERAKIEAPKIKDFWA
ncbi:MULTISPECIES: patatin-like phospholipase family protein [unclassified Chelatococcus]|jgi:NTE family protein|uniref:patatin-like phospholipase family protein n=1 Tax=unclassified Chelatococcus TaxID=2638111 RepID=UPI001BCF7C25|nr:MULTISPECIES: patatin-like phospholipase family protein [unclassified Chelatococcus]CAH1656724.1 PNPLA domain-containing protein [Hyphomicrobiales bacterium]MBS7740577.1 patatin-like phospholipase family protein [Chelatococcus sp. HY11]MBX3544639.1 patatin-like phospholipase family protein [Chelatococcus sp.]MCO5078180.1 patatin-like phospholipase family protein [Chelatococcus sp.]CAH1684652.1 PNPLA domain-containing protein [Hyphomicrobiales bacterium]